MSSNAPGNLPRHNPRWARGDVGREIGKWILAEIKEALTLAGINGRTIDASHVVGVVPTAASKLATYIDGVLCSEKPAINFSDNFECAPNDDPYFTGLPAADVDLSDTGVTPGIYGEAGFFPTLTVDAKGRITAIGEIAESGGGGGATDLDDLTDVTITSPSGGDILTYDSYTGQWVNDAPTAADTVEHEEFTPSAAATTVTLANTPTAIIAVSRNGVVQSAGSGHYSLAGAVLTFTTAFDGTDRVVVAYATGTVTSTGTFATLHVTGDATIDGITYFGTAALAAHSGAAYKDSTAGLILQAATGSANDFTMYNAAGSTAIISVPTGTANVGLGGNLTFNSTSARLSGNLSASTHSQRLIVQGSVSNAQSVLGIMPNGSGTTAQLFTYNTSDPDNAGIARFLVSGTTATIGSSSSGTGTAPTSLTFNAFTSYVFDVSPTVPGLTNPIIRTNSAITSGAGALTGTLTNSPATGNPTKWIPINDNGTTRYIPAW